MVGWIKLHRKIRQNSIFNDAELLRLWLILLTEATHKHFVKPIGRQSVSLEPGQLVTGRHVLADIYNHGLSPSAQKNEKTIWRWIKTLEKSEFVSIKATNKYSIITVLNWHTYQSNEPESVQQIGQQIGHEMPTNKNIKEFKEIKEEKKRDKKPVVEDPPGEKPKRAKPTKPTYEPESVPYKMAAHLLKLIRDRNPAFKEPVMQKWADEMRMTQDLDKRDPHEMKAILEWSQAHPFWRNRVLSPKKFRYFFDTLKMERDDKLKKGGKDGEKSSGWSDKYLDQEELGNLSL